MQMKNTETVLIAGGTGMVGTRLSEMLAADGYGVRILTRRKKHDAPFEQAEWNPENTYMEKDALHNVDHLINLSGTGIADKPWSDKRKREIIESRVLPLKTLIHHLNTESHRVNTLISASAIGYYPKNHTQVMSEDSRPGHDFLSRSVAEWEKVFSSEIISEHIRKAVFRFGVVLSLKGGALPEILKPFRFGFAVTLGHGNQNVSWVHIDDACRALIHALKPANVSGIYNVTAPMPVTFKELIEAIAQVKNRRFIKATVPAFILKLMMGERAGLVLDSIRASSAHLESTGFRFQFPTIEQALKQLLNEPAN